MTYHATNRKTADDATQLLGHWGSGAMSEAKERAERSRDRGNVIAFCHWRQVSRFIAILATPQPEPTVH